MVWFGVNMVTHTATALVLLWNSCLLLLAQPPKPGRDGPDFSQGPDQNTSSSWEGDPDHLLEENQDDPRDLEDHSVFCGESAMRVVLRDGAQEVNVLGLSGDDSMLKCPDNIGCFMVEENGRTILEIGYSGCLDPAEGGNYTLSVVYRDGAGQTAVATVFCAADPAQLASPGVPCSNKTISSEADLPTNQQDAVPQTSQAPVIPSVLGTPPGSDPWMPQAPRIPKDVPGTPPGSDPWMPQALRIPKDAPVTPPGSDPWMPQAPRIPKDVPGTPPGSDPWMPQTLRIPKDVPGKPPGSDPWMPQAPRIPQYVTVSSLNPVPWRPMDTVPWRPMDPELWRPQAPGNPVPVPGMWQGSVSNVGQGRFGDAPHIPPGIECRRKFHKQHQVSVFPMPLSPEKPQGVPNKFWGLDSWMVQPTVPHKDVTVPSSDVTVSPNVSAPGPSKPPSNSMMTFLSSPGTSNMYQHGGCSVPTRQRLPCLPGATAVRCLEKGCCMDPATSTCYYPMNECTVDGHFVFAVPANITSRPLDLAGLTVAGKDACRPVIVNKDVAVFKFRVTECGTHSYRIGLTKVYFADVQSALRTLSLKYGIITRDQFFRLIVECHYSNLGSLGMVSASAGQMVMSPSLPAVVRAKGLYGVQLRIAEDKTYTRFLPHYHQPLRKILSKPVYLEVRLNSPKPEATLLVHYCVAYPRSASSVLILLFDGCPNPFDSDALTLYMSDAPQNRHRRRFEVKAFQFVDQSTNELLDEEIYFMCSTEVCMPSACPCEQTCFDEVCLNCPQGGRCLGANLTRQ